MEPEHRKIYESRFKENNLLFEGQNLISIVLNYKDDYGNDLGRIIWEYVEKRMVEGFKLVHIPKNDSPMLILWREPHES